MPSSLEQAAVLDLCILSSGLCKGSGSCASKGRAASTAFFGLLFAEALYVKRHFLLPAVVM